MISVVFHFSFCSVVQEVSTSCSVVHNEPYKCRRWKWIWIHRFSIRTLLDDHLCSFKLHNSNCFDCEKKIRAHCIEDSSTRLWVRPLVLVLHNLIQTCIWMDASFNFSAVLPVLSHSCLRLNGCNGGTRPYTGYSIQLLTNMRIKCAFILRTKNGRTEM